MTREWTEQTTAEAAEFYPTLTTAEIRRRQGLTAEQIGMAWEQGNTDALLDLRCQEDALTAEMHRRLVAGQV